MKEGPSPIDRVVRTALEANGVDADELAGSRSWRQGEAAQYIRPDAPYVYCGRTRSTVVWQTPEGAVGYETYAPPGGGAASLEVNLHGVRMSETMLAGVAGRPLAEIAALPGDDGLVVTSGEAKPTGTRLAVFLA